MEIGMNTLQRSYKIYNFSLCLQTSIIQPAAKETEF